MSVCEVFLFHMQVVLCAMFALCLSDVSQHKIASQKNRWGNVADFFWGNVADRADAILWCFMVVYGQIKC